MDIITKINDVIDNGTQEQFDKLSVLEKAVVLYLRDSQIDEELFSQARKESDYHEVALPLVSNPRLENLLAPSVLDKYKFFLLDSSLSFSSLEDLSAQEVLAHAKILLNVSKIEGKYFFKEDSLSLEGDADVVFKNFFKKEIGNEINSDIAELCETGGSSSIEIEILANEGIVFFSEISEKEIPLSFWKSPVLQINKERVQDLKRAITYAALALSLSMTACSKVTYKATGPNPPTASDPGSNPGVVNPVDPAVKIVEMTFANQGYGNVEQPTLFSIVNDSRITFPDEITEFSFDGRSETVVLSSLAVYSRNTNSLLCVYDWTGSNFTARDYCEVTIYEGDSLFILGIPQDHSVSLSVKSE